MPELTRDSAATLAPPDGWRWLSRPLLARDDYGGPTSYYWSWGRLAMSSEPGILTLEQIEQVRINLLNWCDQWNIGIGEVASPTILYQLSTLPNGNYPTINRSVTIMPCSTVDSTIQTYDIRNDPMHRDISELYEVVPGIYIRAFTSLMYNGTLMACIHCGVMGRRLYGEELGHLACPSHARRCRSRTTDSVGRRSGCQRYVSESFRYCVEHGTRLTCGCGRPFEHSEDAPATTLTDGTRVCPTCATRVCVECGEVSDARLTDTQWGRLCAPCVVENPAGPHAEDYDDEDVPSEKLIIADATERPVRLASVELELASGANQVCSDLYAAELTPFTNINAYHHTPTTQEPFCYMETDSSLGAGGGELIFHKLRMNDKDEVAKLREAIHIVRNSVKSGVAAMNTSCGLHVHVDAHKFGVTHARNLAIIFNYLEDPLYRMSAARYMRHRGLNYAQKLGKEGLETDQSFGINFLSRDGHHAALNMGNYWRAMNTCRCGAAMIGKHETCECSLNKCTLEFRVYNGTTNYRKIHAYVALSMSLVAYARAHKELRQEDFPACDYTGRKKVSGELKEMWYERLAWMFRNLYFSDIERDSLMYVLRYCQLNELGDEKLAELSRIKFSNLYPIRQPSISMLTREAARARSTSANTVSMSDLTLDFLDDDEEVEYDPF